MDRFDDMRMFAKVVESGSFTGAAARLNTSASLISQHVKDLEERLGARLLNRTTRKVSLTEVGRAYYERCVRILAEVEDAERVAGEMHSAPRGDLRVNASPTFGVMHLAEAIADFAVRFPAISVEVLLSNRVVDLVEEGFDVAVRVEELPDSNLITRHLADCQRVVCGAPSYFAKHGRPRVPADLAHHNCLKLMGLASYRDWLFSEKDGAPFNFTPQGSLRANGAAVLAFAAVAGHGLTYLPTYIVYEELRTGQLIPVLDDYVAAPLPLRALYPHNRQLSAKVRAFVDFLAERFGHEPVWDSWRQARDKTAATAV